MNEKHSGTTSTPRSSQKRPKSSHACEACRARKVHCDNVKPACGACRRRRKAHRVPCVYGQVQASDLSTQYVAQLEQRVRELEGRGAETDELLTTVENARAKRNPGKDQGSDEMMRTVNDESPANGTLYETPFSAPRDGADAMGNFGATDMTFPETSSSAAGFMTQVKTAVAAKFSASQKRPANSMPSRDIPDPWTDPRASLLGRSSTDLFVLPARRIADEMMEVYWGQIHVLYPFLLRGPFTAAYRQLFTGESADTAEVPTYCIMNLAFAIVCQITKKDSPQEKAAAADVYYRRAALLLQTSVIGRCSSELLQALLLMGQYLQSTEWPRRCWVVVGHAIRTAQALGVHIPASTDHLPQQDRELMRRLWHGCIFFDHMVSMTLGRPIVISQADARAVPLPTDIDDAYLSSRPDVDGRQPDGIVSRTCFFTQSVKTSRHPGTDFVWDVLV